MSISILCVTRPAQGIADGRSWKISASVAPAPAPAPDKKAIEGEIAEAQKKLDALNAEIAKRREARSKLTQGTPEYDAANKLVQDIKPDIEKASAAHEAAKAKLKKP